MSFFTSCTSKKVNFGCKTNHLIKNVINFQLLEICSVRVDECQTMDLAKPGSDYIGTTSKTVSGLTCQMWNQQSPHRHKYNLFSHNYCRNPSGGSGGAWCYTTDKNTRWEYCSQIKGNTIRAGNLFDILFRV